MHKFVFFDNKIISPDEASISSLSSAAIYGKGIFTTVAVFDGSVFQWEKHWRRLIANAEKLQLDISEYSETTTKTALSEIIQGNNCINGRARVTFFDESQSVIWPFETSRKTSLLITTGEPRLFSDTIRLAISPDAVNSRSPLAGIKSCNYLEPIMSLDEAKGRGFQEAIRVNERGVVTSACLSNVFWLKGGELLTPGLAAGCLAGTTREFVMENIECREVEAPTEALENADAIFLTSAGIGVVRVAEFQSRQMEKIEHPILYLLPY